MFDATRHSSCVLPSADMGGGGSGGGTVRGVLLV